MLAEMLPGVSGSVIRKSSTTALNEIRELLAFINLGRAIKTRSRQPWTVASEGQKGNVRICQFMHSIFMNFEDI